MADPVTAAVLAAISAMALTGGNEVAKRAVGDAYEALKGLLKRKLGGGEAVEAVEKLEKSPESAGRKQIVSEELAAAKVDDDAELVAAAEQVMMKVRELEPGQRQHVMQAVGSYIAQADRGGIAKVTINRRD